MNDTTSKYVIFSSDSEVNIQTSLVSAFEHLSDLDVVSESKHVVMSHHGEPIAVLDFSDQMSKTVHAGVSRKPRLQGELPIGLLSYHRPEHKFQEIEASVLEAVRLGLSSRDRRSILYSTWLGADLPRDPKLTNLFPSMISERWKKLMRELELTPVYGNVDGTCWYAENSRNGVDIVNFALMVFCASHGTRGLRRDDLSYEVAPDLATFAALSDVDLIPSDYFRYQGEDLKILNASSLNIQNPGRKVFVRPRFYLGFSREKPIDQHAPDGTAVERMTRITKTESMVPALAEILTSYGLSGEFIRARVLNFLEYDLDSQNRITPRVLVEVFLDESEVTERSVKAKEAKTVWPSPAVFAARSDDPDRSRLLELAEKAIREERPSEAARILRSICGYPRVLPTESDEQRTLSLLREIALAYSPSDHARMSTGRALTSSKGLYALGYSLHEAKEYRLAAAVLARAAQDSPQNPTIASEFVTTLEMLALYHDVVDWLRPRVELRENFFLQYFFVFALIMSGDDKGASLEFTTLGSMLKSKPTIEDPEGQAAESQQYEVLAGMFERMKHVRRHFNLDENDLIGWNAVINGFVQLRCSEIADDTLNGRHDRLLEDNDSIIAALARVQHYLTVTNQPVEVVYAFPDFSSWMLASALARVLDVPIVPVTTAEDVTNPGIGVLYHQDESMKEWDAEHREALFPLFLQHGSGFVLWAHGSGWSDPFPVSPDIITYQVDEMVPPWLDLYAELGRVGADGSARVRVQIEEYLDWIAARSSEVNIEECQTVAAQAMMTLDFRDVSSAHTLGVLRDGGPRLRQRVGSRVKSQRRES